MFEELLCFEIRTIEWLLANRKQELEIVHMCQQFMIVWLCKGRLLHCIDLRQYKIEKDELYGIAPRQVHQITPIDNPEGYIIYLSAAAFEGIDTANLLFDTNIFHSKPVNLLRNSSEEIKNDIGDIFCKLIREFEINILLRLEILGSLMKVLLTYLTYEAKNTNDEFFLIKRTDVVKKFFTLLDKNYKNKKQVTDYALELAITPSYLNEIIKKSTGESASYHIRQRIISEAKQQAVFNGLNMKETAYFLGFDDLAHFSKYFKNAVGINFTSFKNSRLLSVKIT